MAPRPSWQGYLRLSLVTCPVALYPAISESEKISFNQINKKTGKLDVIAKPDANSASIVAPGDPTKTGDEYLATIPASMRPLFCP